MKLLAKNMSSSLLVLLVLSVAVICIGCTTTPPEGYKEWKESLLAKRDCSFSVTGQAVETKNITSVIEYSKKDAKKKSSPEADILLKGQLYSPWYTFRTYFFFRPIKLKNQSDDTHKVVTFLPQYKQRYFWDGTVTIDGKSLNALVDFNVFADQDGNGKIFVLNKAALGEASLDFPDPFDMSGKPEDYPFLIGYANISDVKYRIYAVMDNNPEKTTFYNEIFFNPLQKFQFIDDQNTVVAELEKDKYTVYDTATDSLKENFKYAAALLIALRHSTMEMKNIKDSWYPPLFYRYVYPEV